MSRREDIRHKETQLSHNTKQILCAETVKCTPNHPQITAILHLPALSAPFPTYPHVPISQVSTGALSSSKHASILGLVLALSPFASFYWAHPSYPGQIKVPLYFPVSHPALFCPLPRSSGSSDCSERRPPQRGVGGSVLERQKKTSKKRSSLSEHTQAQHLRTVQHTVCLRPHPSFPVNLLLNHAFLDLFDSSPKSNKVPIPCSHPLLTIRHPGNSPFVFFFPHSLVFFLYRSIALSLS